jgi:Fe-coproporphyrin III synthase
MFKDKMDKLSWKVDALWWIITGLCNLKCKHCYLESPHQKYKQLPFDKCVEVIRQAQEAGIQKIFITGGEPFFRKDMLSIIDLIYNHGLKIVGIETNATLIDENIITSIHDKEIIWHVSYDGYKCHENLRGVLGAEKKTIAAIKKLKQAGFKVAINTALSLSNAQTLLQTYRVLKKLHIDSWQIFPIVNIGNAKTMQTEKLSFVQEGECYLKVFNWWLDDNKPFALSLRGVLTNKREMDGNLPKIQYICEYFRSTVTLMPDGMLIPCCRYIECSDIMQEMKNIFLRSIKEQTQKSTLKQIKNTTIQELLSYDNNKNCRNCDLLDACQLGCRINAYIETGDLYEKEKNNCNLMNCYYKKYFYQHDFKQ